MLKPSGWIREKSPVSFASRLASVDAHMAFVKVDTEELDVLEAEIGEGRKSAPAHVNLPYSEK